MRLEDIAFGLEMDGRVCLKTLPGSNDDIFDNVAQTIQGIGLCSTYTKASSLQISHDFFQLRPVPFHLH